MTSSLKSIQLVAGVNICLAPVGPEADAAAAQFIKAFRSVWGQLPATAKAVLAAACHGRPATVFLTRRWTGQDGRLAQCAEQGSIFHFYSLALPRMPDDVLADCIAHELARAFFFATRDPYHCGGLNDSVYEKPLQYRLAEALTHELCDAWGFNPRLLSRWCADNVAWLEANANSPST
jgi:hypothetical protein